tara:strand:- start:872 stop:1324 length:453 start_codon:yes stop_codon:yes gene_type:complete
MLEAVSKEKKSTEVMFSGNQLFELQQAVQTHLNTSEKLQGNYVRFFLANLESLDPILIPLVEKHAEVIRKYANLDEKGAPVRGQEGFTFSEDKKKAAYDAESKVIWDDTKMTANLSKMPLSLFDLMPINTKDNNKIVIILNHLVELPKKE